MTKYTRLTGKVFGSSATATGDDPEIGQFGSALAGTYNGTTDISLIQSLPAWQKGFIGCVTPSTQFPPLPEMTGFGKVLSHQICYLLQQGVPEYDSGTTYYTGNWCSYNNSLYTAKVDGFSNIAPTDTTKWDKFTGGFSRNYGEIVTSSLPLTDSTLHLADGSLLNNTDYPEFVSYIAELYNNNLQTINLYCYSKNTSDQVYLLTTSPSLYDAVYDITGSKIGYINSNPSGGITVEFYGDREGGRYYRASSLDTTAVIPSVNYLTLENEWQSTYTTYGECGKYVYNSSTNTVRLPLYNSYFTNTVNSQNLGTLTEASLPNIKGAFNHETTGGYANGAFAVGPSVAGENAAPGGDTDHEISFNAHWYNSIYKDSATTVNTQSIKQLVYIVIAK